jgi:hypothetical protein
MMPVLECFDAGVGKKLPKRLAGIAIAYEKIL